MKKLFAILCACFFTTILLGTGRVENFMEIVDYSRGIFEPNIPCKCFRELLALIPDQKIRDSLLWMESELFKLNIVRCPCRRDFALDD